MEKQAHENRKRRMRRIKEEHLKWEARGEIEEEEEEKQ